MSSYPKVALVSGFWAQNIGNAFFNIGGKWILGEIFGHDNVQFIQDQPAYRTFYDQSKGAPRNYANLLSDLDVEYVVLQGPMLTTTFRAIWEPAFREYRRRGIKVILLGAAFFKYTPQEISAAKAFIEEYPPVIISTRDAQTYEIINKWVPFTYNGIDSAFFVPKAFKPLNFKSGYMTLNFDRFPEPTITLGDVPQQKPHFSFAFDDNTWNLHVPAVQNYLANRGKAHAYLGHLLDFRTLPESINGIKIIRPEHRYAPHMTHKIYQHPNSFVSDEAFTYFSVYAGTKLTLADRVHACVMTLAYGNPAMLFTTSPRQALFARLGLNAIRTCPVTLAPEYLESERQAELNFLIDAVSKL
jgi:hypothetical protein